MYHCENLEWINPKLFKSTRHIVMALDYECVGYKVGMKSVVEMKPAKNYIFSICGKTSIGNMKWLIKPKCVWINHYTNYVLTKRLIVIKQKA